MMRNRKVQRGEGRFVRGRLRSRVGKVGRRGKADGEIEEKEVRAAI